MVDTPPCGIPVAGRDYHNGVMEARVENMLVGLAKVEGEMEHKVSKEACSEMRQGMAEQLNRQNRLLLALLAMVPTCLAAAVAITYWIVSTREGF